jgi:RimJ/RimL family protein N-acetyltransferase
MTDPNFFIETPRLYLIYFQPNETSHCDWLVELYNTPEFITSIGGKPTSITTRSSARNQIATSFQEEHARNGYGRYMITLKAEPRDPLLKPSEKFRSCEPVGMVSLMRGPEGKGLTVPDVGFITHPTHMRKGIAKEAAQALLQYAREKLGVGEVLGLCDVSNEASQGVLRSLGFKSRGERAVKSFGGKIGLVWVMPEMSEDLSVYGL